MPFEGYKRRDENSGYIQAGTVPKTTENVDGTLTQHVNVDSMPTGIVVVSSMPSVVVSSLPTGTYFVSTTPSDNLTMSEFSEFRVASPGNRADVEFIYDKQPLLYDDISSGSGTVVHQTASRDLLISINSGPSGTAAGMRQHYWTPYTPGSGQEIDITGTLDNAGLGGGTVYLFLRSNVSGSVVTTTYPQSGWLASRTGVDWSKSQIFRMSFQSLKVGRVQFALVRGGIPTKVLEITNDNIRNTGYWQQANQPPYWRLYNNGTNTIAEFGYGNENNGIGVQYVFSGIQPTATSRAICATVKSQGGASLFEMSGFPFVTPPTGTFTVSTTLIPLVSIRVASTFNGLTNRELVIPTGYSLQTDNAIQYLILYRPTLTNPNWQPINSAYSGVEYDISASAVSGGVQIDGDLLSSGVNQTARVSNVLGKIIMSLGSGATDILTIAAVRTGSNNGTVRAVIKGIEVR